MSSPEQSVKSVTHLFNNVPGYQVNEIIVSRTQRKVLSVKKLKKKY